MTFFSLNGVKQRKFRHALKEASLHFENLTEAGVYDDFQLHINSYFGLYEFFQQQDSGIISK